MKKTRAKGNDVITNVISLRQSAFRIDFFDANIKLASLPFPLPRQRRPGELARRLFLGSRPYPVPRFWRIPLPGEWRSNPVSRQDIFRFSE